jgi:hypothetical protein
MLPQEFKISICFFWEKWIKAERNFDRCRGNFVAEFDPEAGAGFALRVWMSTEAPADRYGPVTHEFLKGRST